VVAHIPLCHEEGWRLYVGTDHTRSAAYHASLRTAIANLSHSLASGWPLACIDFCRMIPASVLGCPRPTPDWYTRPGQK